MTPKCVSVVCVLACDVKRVFIMCARHTERVCVLLGNLEMCICVWTADTLQQLMHLVMNRNTIIDTMLLRPHMMPMLLLLATGKIVPILRLMMPMHILCVMCGWL